MVPGPVLAVDACLRPSRLIVETLALTELRPGVVAARHRLRRQKEVEIAKVHRALAEAARHVVVALVGLGTVGHGLGFDTLGGDKGGLPPSSRSGLSAGPNAHANPERGVRSRFCSNVLHDHVGCGLPLPCIGRGHAASLPPSQGARPVQLTSGCSPSVEQAAWGASPPRASLGMAGLPSARTLVPPGGRLLLLPSPSPPHCCSRLSSPGARGGGRGGGRGRRERPGRATSDGDLRVDNAPGGLPGGALARELSGISRLSGLSGRRRRRRCPRRSRSCSRCCRSRC